MIKKIDLLPSQHRLARGPGSHHCLFDNRNHQRHDGLVSSQISWSIKIWVSVYSVVVVYIDVEYNVVVMSCSQPIGFRSWVRLGYRIVNVDLVGVIFGRQRGWLRSTHTGPTIVDCLSGFQLLAISSSYGLDGLSSLIDGDQSPTCSWPAHVSVWPVYFFCHLILLIQPF